MSRHVTEIARKTLIRPFPASTTISSTLAARLRPCNFSALPREHILSRPTLRAFSSGPRIVQHVPEKNTSETLPRSTALVAGHWGWRWHERPAIYLAKDSAVWNRTRLAQQRWYSDSKSPEEARKAAAAKEAEIKSSGAPKAARDASAQPAAAGASKTILDRLPHIHRPSKDELLAAATGFWQRLGIRFKWLSIRSFRPFNHDEIGAFLSWVFYAHVLWIIIGTTTFISAAIWAINTVFAQETLAGWVGNYLTKSSGVKVVFENAIVPAWGDGVITFKNVFVSRRPGQNGKKTKGVSKGSSTTAALAAEAAMADKSTPASDTEDDGNYSQFDVTISTVNVTVSFAKWFNGKGLLRDVEIKGVRGVIDRTNVHWDPELQNVDPKSWRHEHSTGDFEIDRFKMDDVLLTVYQPNDFRPFTVSVFNCELPRLRKQWL